MHSVVDIIIQTEQNIHIYNTKYALLQNNMDVNIQAEDLISKDQGVRSKSSDSQRSRSRQKKHKKQQKNKSDSDSDFDMFADEQEIKPKTKDKQEIKKQSSITDDAGYYIPVEGTLIGKKYKIIDKLGKGVYGNVVKVQDIEAKDTQKIYAVKILRKTQTTEASGHIQYRILTQIHNKRKLKRILKVFDFFKQHGHFCIVCELLNIDLRSFAHRKQPTLADIRIYAIGMILAYHQLRISKVVHADIKPDNFLFKQPQTTQIVNERAVIDNLKLADFGTALYEQQYDHTAEQRVARYYRAPQIILGTQLKPSETHALDVWAIGCSLFQLYTNKFLFNGGSNNQMLKMMMETCGKFSAKMLSKSMYAWKHFDEDYNMFLLHMTDKLTKQIKMQKIQVNVTGERQLMNLLKRNNGNKGEDVKQLQNFKDFLQKCLTLNPRDRLTPQQAIEHPFLHYQTKLQF